MNIRRKLRTAALILKRDGVGAFIRETGRTVLGGKSGRPDEAAIVFQAFQRRRNPSDQQLMIDVGAHFGGALRPFAEAGWKVFAYEPDPGNRSKLEAAFGSAANVTIDPRGLSNEPRLGVPFFTSSVSTGISGLSAFHESHQPAGTVDLTTVGEICRERNIPKIDFLKIDTEGFDLLVLKGVPWNTTTPDVVLCEFEDSKTKPLGYSFHDLAGYLQEKGYKLIVSEWFPIRKYGGLHDWRRFVHYPCKLREERAWGNAIAARPGRDFDSVLQACREFGPVEDGERG